MSTAPVSTTPVSTSPARVRALARALAALAVLGVPMIAAGGCRAPAPGPTSSASPSTSAPSTAPPSADGASEHLTAGDTELEVTTPGAHGATVTDGPTAGTTTLTLDLAGGTTATLTLASPGTLAVHRDGSVSVLDADGVVAAGLGAPDGGAGVTGVDATHVQIDGTTRSGDGAVGTVTTTLGTVGVSSTDWGEREGGRSLAIDPTAWARSASEAGTELVWAELVATYPEVDTATMHDQLECHAIGAPDKATWNLEPWRPDVGLVATMAARCNPIP